MNLKQITFDIFKNDTIIKKSEKMIKMHVQDKFDKIYT